MSKFNPKSFDTEATVREAALLRQLDVDTALSVMSAPGGERVVSALYVSEVLGVPAKILRAWREETVATGNLIGPPWVVIKVGPNHLIGYLASDMVAFMQTYVSRVHARPADPAMAAKVDAAHEEYCKMKLGEREYNARKAEERAAAESFYAFSGSSPPAASDQGDGGAA